MPQQNLYVCDKTQDIEKLPKRTARCSREGNGVSVTLSVVAHDGGESRERHFCNEKHADFWLRRQRVNGLLPTSAYAEVNPEA